MYLALRVIPNWPGVGFGGIEGDEYVIKRDTEENIKIQAEIYDPLSKTCRNIKYYNNGVETTIEKAKLVIMYNGDEDMKKIEKCTYQEEIAILEAIRPLLERKTYVLGSSYNVNHGPSVEITLLNQEDKYKEILELVNKLRSTSHVHLDIGFKRHFLELL